MKALFRSDRLLYRQPAAEDFDRLWALLTDPVAKAYTGGVTRLSYEDRLRLFLEECAGELSAQGAEYAVIEERSGRYLGYCGFRQSPSLGCPEFLFGCCRDSRGRGYATEAAKAVLDHLFRQYSHSCYIALVDPRNLASKRVLLKAGFTVAADFPTPPDEPLDVYQIRQQDLREQA
ncbi:MAG: GNAT family N-acetyltransferase [Christensenellales bacterium]